MKYNFICYICGYNIKPNDGYITCQHCLIKPNIYVKSDLEEYVYYYNPFSQVFIFRNTNSVKNLYLRFDDNLTFKQLISYLDNLVFI
jgi:hypothetical protein